LTEGTNLKGLVSKYDENWSILLHYNMKHRFCQQCGRRIQGRFRKTICELCLIAEQQRLKKNMPTLAPEEEPLEIPSTEEQPEDEE
jgi:hypothetical protein